MIYVTHDQTEAMTLADVIVVLRDGRIEQTGSPRDLYENPTNIFVAGFIGSPRMNLLDAKWLGRGSVGIGPQQASAPALHEEGRSGDKLTFGIRPEHLTIAEGEGRGLDATVDFAEYLGGTQYLYCHLSDGQPIVAEYRSSIPIRPGAAIRLSYIPEHCHLFGENGQRLG
jgi:lactose/L-arabinose transport system ATP-binding protein